MDPRLACSWPFARPLRWPNRATAQLLAVLLLSPALLASQPESPANVFGETVDVRLLEIEAVITDENGNRISGLTRDDFDILIDGAPVSIDFFSEQNASRQPATSGAGRPPGTNYLVFVDAALSYAPHREAALLQVAQGLSRLSPNDQIAIVTFDGRNLEISSPWERSLAKIQEVLRRLARRGRTFLFLDAHNGRPCAGPATREGFAVTPLERSIERQLEKMSLALSTALQSLPRPPGRRVMIALAGAWPESPSVFARGRDCFQDVHNRLRTSRIFDSVFEVANRLSYTVYPVDLNKQAAANRGVAGLNVRAAETHSTLSSIARETGGLAFLAGKRLSFFEGVAEDVHSYYLLSVTPPSSLDDEVHAITISLKRPGLEARHRRSYKDLSPASEAQMLTEGALLLGSIPGSRPLDVVFGDPAGRGKRIRLPLQISIPMDEIVMLQRGGLYRADLELRIGSIDEHGRRSEVASMPIQLAGEHPPGEGQFSIFESSVRLRKKPQQLVVSVRDPVGEALFSAVERVGPGDSESSATASSAHDRTP